MRNKAENLEKCLIAALEQTGSEITLLQKEIIHSYCMKIYFIGFRNSGDKKDMDNDPYENEFKINPD